MCEQSVEHIDEAEDTGGQARNEYDVDLEDPGSTDERRYEGGAVTQDEEYKCCNRRR